MIVDKSRCRQTAAFVRWSWCVRREWQALATRSVEYRLTLLLFAGKDNYLCNWWEISVLFEYLVVKKLNLSIWNC